MLNKILADFYVRDIRKMMEEVNLFNEEENLWKTTGSLKNPAGNLVLHIIGGTNYLIGTLLGQTGYVRNRPEEFASKGVERTALITQLEALVPMIEKVLGNLTPEQMEAEYPIMFDDGKRPVSYVLVRLLAHLDYHLGQVNYLRRVLE
ncbi:MAG TPA: DinB family protein [Chitinophagaceae bacterium]|nr:DinB family protein [Chitinophagaceae bacterium]